MSVAPMVRSMRTNADASIYLGMGERKPKTSEWQWRVRLARVRSWLIRNRIWLGVLTPLCAVLVAALGLVPSFVAVSKKSDAAPAQSVQVNHATNPVIVGPNAQIRELRVGDSEVVEAHLVELKAAGQGNSHKLDEILRRVSMEKGVPLEPLRVVLRRLGEYGVPEGEVPRVLEEKAAELLELRAQLKRLALPEVEGVRKEALKRLDVGDLTGARELLQQSRLRLREQRQDHSKREASLLEDEARIDRIELRYLAASQKYAECAELVTFDQVLRARCLAEQAMALFHQGVELGDNDALEEALGVYRVLLRERPRSEVPLEWATFQSHRGDVLRVLGERESGTARLKQAVQVYQAALQERRRERVPLDWAQTQSDLGFAFWRLGERQGDTEGLEKAVQAYQAALQERERSRVPLDWAETKHRLGKALWRLGERESGTGRLEQAVLAHQAALREWTRDRVPLDWARIQNDLGNALLALGERESGTERLLQATQAYQAALLERTRGRVPLDWAMTQNNLGVALLLLGARESGTGRLERAVQTFRASLQEWTRERVPFEWARVQNNLGLALQAIGHRSNDAASLEHAVRAYQAALQEWTRERAPLEWAKAQDNLAQALQMLGEHESGTARLEQAVRAHQAALQEWTRLPFR